MMGRKRHETQRELFLRKRPLYTDGNEPKKQEEWIMQVKRGDRLNQGPGQGEGGSRTQAETLAQMGAGQTTGAIGSRGDAMIQWGGAGEGRGPLWPHLFALEMRTKAKSRE